MEPEELILAMWDDYEREGLRGIFRWAAPDARWRPHSASGRVFRDTTQYRAAGLLEEAGLDRRLAPEALVGLHREAA
jgi:hypothetical protein